MNRLLSIVFLLSFIHLCNQVGAQTAGPAGINSGILLWLDGSNVNNTSPATNPSNGTAVTTWKDISGNGNDATVLAGQNTPAITTAQINGKDVMKFTRTNGGLGTVYSVAGIDIRATTLPKITIFTVYRQGANIAGEWHGVWGNDNGAWDRFFMPRFSGVNDGIVAVGPPTNAVTVANAGTIGTTKLLTAVYDYGVANGSTIYYNGFPVQSVTDNTHLTAAQSTLRIGWDGDDNPFNGDIAEMVVYNRKLTDCEIQAINRYFGLKFGVTISSASITPSSKAYFCPAGNATLTASSGSTYQWLLNGTAISGATSSTYIASAYGKYQVVIGNGSCLDTSSATTVYQSGPVLYVDSSASVSGSGLSWGSPLKTVAEALDVANHTTCATQIWVRKGTYYPMADATIATSRDSSHRILRNNIKLYGGFAGTETLLSQRNATTNLTKLSGDIGAANDSTDNSYHVMTIIGNAANNIDSNTVVDGFTITGGNAENTGTPTINGMLVYRGAGGGINTAGLGAGSKSSPLLENLIITRNTAVWGGGLYGQGHTSGTSSPVVRNCSFISNKATSEGGGVHFYTDGAGGSVSPTFISCTFSNNWATFRGGAGWFNGGTPAVANAVIRLCTISNNYTDNVNSGSYIAGGFAFYGATSTPVIKRSSFSNNFSSYGGGICTAGPLQNLLVDSCTFNGDNAINSGGGIVFQNAGLTVTNSKFTATKASTGGALSAFVGATINVDNCDFINDSVTAYGAAFYHGTALVTNITKSRFINTYGAVVGAIDKPGSGNLNVKDCFFSGNTTREVGGIMNNFSGTSNFTNCVMENNSTTTTANTGGGTIHVQAGTTVNFYNSTLSNNTSASTTVPGSNALSVDATATVNLYNTIIWGNTTTQIAGAGTIAYNNSLVRGATVTAPNLSKNPRFVNAADPDGADNTWGTTDDGLKLSLCSPAINAGSNALIPAGTTTDAASATRIQQTTVDMGAYESALTNIVVIPSVSIAPNPAGTICSGTNVTFTATPVNGGTSPAYQWIRNGVFVGAAVPTHASNTLTNGTTIQVRMISTATCPDPDTVFSNIITMSVNTTPVITGVTSTNPTTCGGTNGSITIQGLNPLTAYTTSYFNGSTTTTASLTSNASGNLQVAGLAAGTYSNITVTLAGCSTTHGTAVTLSPPPTPVISGSSFTHPTCATNDGTITLNGLINGSSYTVNYSRGGIAQAPVVLTAASGSVVLVGLGSGSYTNLTVTLANCVSNNIPGPIVLNTPVAPAITSQPSSITICQGPSVTFSVSATGTALTYQWQVDNGGGFVNLTNTAPYSNVTTPTLIITTPSTTLNGYQYRVIVSGTCSPAATSTAAVLTVNGIPTITTQPTNAATCNGGNTSFTVSATGTGLNYQWQVNTGAGYTNITNAGVYSGTTTSTLTITGATLTMSGYNYRVIINGTCSPAVTSAVRSLIINVPPVISTQPVDKITCAGSNTTFQVFATGSGLTYQWEQNSGSGFVPLTNTAPYSGVTTANLVINGTPATMDGYQYRVIVTGTCAPSVTSQTATLNTNLVPTITGQSSLTSVCPGAPIVFSVTATGTALTYQWQVNTGSGFGPVPNSPVYSGANSASLTITPTTAMTGYQYRVVVSGTCTPPAISAVRTLNVYNPVTIVSQSMATTACEGWTTRLGLRATGGGMYYQWQVKTASGYQDIGVDPPYSGANTDTLTITDVSESLAGKVYRCVVRETVLCNLTIYSEDIPLTVNLAPKITPDKITAPFFGTATFSVPADGTTYQWQENRNNGGGFKDLTESNLYAGVNTNTLVVTPLSFEMSGFQYRCIVSGLCHFPMASKPGVVTVDQTLSVKNTIQTGETNITVYPNPTSSDLNIRFDKPVKGKTEITVLNKLGQVVHTSNAYMNSGTTATINVGALAAGVYTVQVVNEDAVIKHISLFTKQ